MNRIRYGLKNAHYAPAILDTSGRISGYEPPKFLPGAVRISISPVGETRVWYDLHGTRRKVIFTRSGYTGELELAIIPDGFRRDVLDEEEDQSGLLYERVDRQDHPFALLFEFEGDAHRVRHALYYCIANGTALEGETLPTDPSLKTEIVTLEVLPDAQGVVRAKADDTRAIYAHWYEAVPVVGI